MFKVTNLSKTGCKKRGRVLMAVRHTIILSVLLCSFNLLCGQVKISGKIISNKRIPLASISIGIKGTYDGGVTNDSGYYSFTTTEKGSMQLVISSTNYLAAQKDIVIENQPIEADFVLKEKVNEMSVVTVTAGSFGGGLGKKSVTVLTTLDVVTSSGSYADVSKAVNTLPGAQQVGEQEGLFVRGGDGTEAKQFVDGVLIPNPYFGSVPGVASRSRFDLSLLKGFAFSTGGYSALYGQALSSALSMETIDLPQKSEANLFVTDLVLSAGIQKLAKNNKWSWGATYSYTNLGPYTRIVKQNIDYARAPQFHNGNVNFRIKTKKGIIKFYTSFGTSNINVRYANIDSVGLKNRYAIYNYNLFSSLNWNEHLTRGWRMNLSAGYNINDDNINSQLQDAFNKPVASLVSPIYDTANFGLLRNENLIQVKAVFTKKWSNLSTLKFGGEYWNSNSGITYKRNKFILKDNLSAAFAESEIYFTNSFAATLGVRAEYSSIINKMNIAPRLSIAYKLNKTSSLSAAYGFFYQKPENNLLADTSAKLGFIRATHYLINYQKQINGIFLRVEAYYKQYDNLVKTWPYKSNAGSGYANGIEFYLRDKYKTIKSLDYSISYSYINTKREYLNYPVRLAPTFAANHTANLVTKKYFPKLNTGISLSYTYASGRPYYNFRLSSTSDTKYRIADSGVTRSYQTMDFSLYYLTKFGKASAIVMASVTNLTGRNNVFGYNYSLDGVNRAAIGQPATRLYFIGVLLNWGVDRRRNAADNL
jgi:vitamin B12 transporter